MVNVSDTDDGDKDRFRSALEGVRERDRANGAVDFYKGRTFPRVVVVEVRQ